MHKQSSSMTHETCNMACSQQLGCCAGMQVMYDANMRRILPLISCPALIVVGEKDFR